MGKINGVDLLLSLEPHGWSVAYLLVEDKKYEFLITHVFNNPYEETMAALLNLSKGQSAAFSWFSEPGGVLFELNPDQKTNRITVTLSETDYVASVESNAIDNMFTIDIKHLMVLFYYQFKKISVLLLDETYAKDRGRYFPFEAFWLFERIALQYTS